MLRFQLQMNVKSLNGKKVKKKHADENLYFYISEKLIKNQQ